MIRKLGEFFTKLSHRLMPDPFIFALFLTFLTFLLGITLAGRAPLEMTRFWGEGLMGLLSFTTQMVLVLVTGHALANSPAVKRGLSFIAGIPKNQFWAIAITTFTAASLGLVNWGFGLIGGALLAREVAISAFKRGIKVSYPLLVASAYTGLMVWHGGLSGSAPLLVATPGHFLEKEIGIIGIKETLGAPYNLTINLLLLLSLPIVMGLMSPKKGERIEEIPPELLPEEKKESLLKEKTPAQRLENSVIITLIIGLIGLAYLINYFGKTGFGGLNLNSLNISFLILGIILHKTPIAYVRAVNEAIKGCAGIILQFPFYAGIMAMMKESGLVSITANFFVQVSNSTTYPFLSFLSAGLINFFVPSGGGQWAVQGPIMVKAAPQLGVSFSRTLMSVAYGDQVTNMLQPFWTLPLLALTRLEARQIMGYAAVAFIVGFIIMALGITFLPG